MDVAQYTLHTVPLSRFPTLADARRLAPSSGRHFLRAQYDAGGKMLRCIANQLPLRREQIDRDHTWTRRLELAALFQQALGHALHCRPRALPHTILLRLPSPLYLPAFPTGATHDEMIQALTRNSQLGFKAMVASYLAGRTHYDLARYSQHGPTYTSYSHIDHLGWVYAEQIQLIVRFLEAYWLRRITVVDLGTGGGHFLTTLGQLFAERAWLYRARLIGVDHAERDMQYAREIAQERTLNILFLTESLQSPAFQDRQRQLGGQPCHRALGR
jgi:hypothetical protein